MPADSEMRGVHAKCDIPPGTLCMTIPRRCLITVEMGQATEIGRAIMASDLDLDAPKHIYLMIYILWDRKVNGSKSFFHPYYEILPPTLQNMPVFWNAHELAELKGSHLLHQIADRNQAITKDYVAICRVAPALERLCTLQEFKWARMCVCSRNFGLQMDGHRTSAMVPHADMLNHFRPRETKWTFDAARQAFTITTLQPISAGAEVLDSYGQKCNHRFLLNYGFAVEDNTEIDGFCPNEVPVELTLKPTASVEHWGFWLLCDPSATKRVRVCASNNESTRFMFSLLRTIALSELELQTVQATERSCGDVRHPVSIRNEREALHMLHDLCEQQKNRYPTSLEEDRMLLQNFEQYPLYSNERHAKIQVRGEKEVLEHFQAWSRIGISVLDVLEKELDRRTKVTLEQSFEYVIRNMEADERVHHTVLRYCADVLGSLRREELKRFRHVQFKPRSTSHSS